MPDIEKHQLSKPSSIHHAAYRCRDAEQTRWFYEDILGFKLTAALVFDEISGTDLKREYMHLFFEMPDGNFIAFFDEPDNAAPAKFEHRDGLDLHVAFEIDAEEDLQKWRQRIKEAGVKCAGPIDHGFISSIYCYDPNGIQVELACKKPEYQAVMEAKEKVVRDEMASWTERTREQKVALFGEEEVDRRSVSKWL